MKIKAVIDRFEGNTAVLNVGEDERRIEAPRSSLPKGSKEGDWLQVELEGKRPVKAESDPEETERPPADRRQNGGTAAGRPLKEIRKRDLPLKRMIPFFF